MFDQPDYSRVDHPSCDESQEPSCGVCGEAHEETECPYCVCSSCGERVSFLAIDQDTDTCYSCCPPCKASIREAARIAERAAQNADADGRPHHAALIRAGMVERLAAMRGAA